MTHDAREQELKPLLTDEFLNTLVKAIQYVGWSVDMIEIEGFADELFRLSGKPMPEISISED